MGIFSMILSLLSGVALFLFGMSLMGDGLKMVAGNKLEAFLYRMTNTPLKGVALGTGVTSVIQSSSATTVMVIGFVNSGMMKLKQQEGTPIYPDANSTLRLTYGKIGSYSPKDGVEYSYYTTLKGVMEKEDPDNFEFVVPAKLKELYNNKDFGRYAMKNGEMPICFATASAVRLLSPVSITVLTPMLWSSDIACLLSSFTTSATAIIPASLPSMAKYSGVLPSPASLSPAASIAESRIPFDLSRDALPPIADFPFISALTP